MTICNWDSRGVPCHEGDLFEICVISYYGSGLTSWESERQKFLSNVRFHLYTGN